MLVNAERDYQILDSLIDTIKTESEDGLYVDLFINQDCSVNRFLFHLSYDYNLMHVVDIQMESLFDTSMKIELVAERQPGLIGLGQVNPGLIDQEFQADTKLARITFSLTGPQPREASVASTTDVGLKLRSQDSFEFVNCDVPLQVQWTPKK